MENGSINLRILVCRKEITTIMADERESRLLLRLLAIGYFANFIFGIVGSLFPAESFSVARCVLGRFYMERFQKVKSTARVVISS